MVKNRYGSSCGEWELSVHPDGPSIVASGEYQGLSFPKYLEKKRKGCFRNKGKHI